MGYFALFEGGIGLGGKKRGGYRYWGGIGSGEAIFYPGGYTRMYSKGSWRVHRRCMKGAPKGHARYKEGSWRVNEGSRRVHEGSQD